MSHPRNSVASNNRTYGTVELFEQYWVHGCSTEDLDCGKNALTYRGIPTRSNEDAQELRHGAVSVDELWDEYLTEFQINLAQELQLMMLADYREC